MYQEQPTRKPLTINTLAKMKRDREKFAVLTAYDASFAALLDAAGVEVILVGDSLGMVVQGQRTTVPVTMDDMVYHTRNVARGSGTALLMADMPFASYATVEQGVRNAARLMQEGGAHMVKLEGGAVLADTVRQLGRNGIPVCAHLGLLPQSVHKLGGYKVQGREEAAARLMIDEALALQEAGADIALVECIPAELGARLTEALDIPLIGIGAGPSCDAQVLVSYDMLGITFGRRPRFSKNFMTGHDSLHAAVAAYVAAVKSGEFPGPEHCLA
ncbi:MAG: 3-methyl-2-oxobutanoate hydroxymethyltransferase [Candidatus Competibacteraceae bacterium]|nr:3-methyl-2-oxobutanoate hydroxymethyltransferase [Candidatus Competibacteraceae bacterium]MBK7984700.1 3-methyl-2-oxobutanoate hydroxymethyltransferase [Candidatus Competibacteraceae bacterium]MBK8899534.1 3-methyl-2-oxobutanoate hydroxymethyltransferase [Candidatus Competibacteraceae bacterium]MBK8964536.1 3-methyl-2-oxobutanoate hydroxymethyltransferase [Candidatus Competibacteraceae bacterium]MBK9952531.1 3-methyl-2-oxobutanoate hydroxymethyltransferase [Candidatus Competibacteraceae bact